MAARVALPESKLRARRRRRRNVILALVALALLALFAGLVFLAHASFLRISRIELKGLETVPPASVTSFIEQKLEGSYFWVFPKRNIFLYPKREIRDSMLVAFPMLKNVDVHALDFQALEVSVVEREPRALWCGPSASEGSCMFMDDTGAVYAAAPEFSSPIYVRYFGEVHGERAPRQFLTQEEFSSLAALVGAVAQKESLAAQTVEVDSHHDARALFENGFELIFSLEDRGGDVYERYALARTAEPFIEHALSEFAYLDLRFGDKLYYKLKGEE